MNFNFNTPSDAVFKERFGKNNKALFEGQIDLANFLLVTNSKYRTKNPLTVKSTVNQIFTGERNLSKNLADALFQAIEPKFDKNKYDYEKYKELLLEKFRSIFEDRSNSKKNQLGGKDYRNLIDLTQKAKRILIVTLEPAELHNTELADGLKNELLNKIGILGPEDKTKDTEYKFYFPKSTDGSPGKIAKKFWEKLSQYAIDTHNFNREGINQKLLEKNEKEIKTFLIDEKMATIPVVFLDYETERISGFCVSYQSGNDTLSVAQLSTDVIYAWKKNIYPELNAIPENQIVEYKFKSII